MDHQHLTDQNKESCPQACWSIMFLKGSLDSQWFQNVPLCVECEPSVLGFLRVPPQRQSKEHFKGA